MKSARRLRIAPVPFNVEVSIVDNLAADIARHPEASPTAEMVAAYLADALTREHLPSLIKVANNQLDILDGQQGAPSVLQERRELKRFIARCRTAWWQP